MSGLDKFFDQKQAPVHPKVRYWQSVLISKKDGIERLQVTFVREKQGLVFGPAKLFIHFHNAAMEEVQTPDEVDWDERINAELVKMKIKATSRENESERFGMVFNDRLRFAENRFGDTFYNAVLVTYLKQSAFAKLSPANEILNTLQEYSPSQGRQRADCEDMIEEAIGYCINALHDSLDYSRDETTTTVAEALTYYLDERFSVSDRKLLGW